MKFSFLNTGGMILIADASEVDEILLQYNRYKNAVKNPNVDIVLGNVSRETWSASTSYMWRHTSKRIYFYPISIPKPLFFYMTALPVTAYLRRNMDRAIEYKLMGIQSLYNMLFNPVL